jgi:predicted metal-dependent hydrolase
MYQLKLLFKQNRETLMDYLENVTGKTINLSITDNTASMLSIREKKNKEILVRLHWMFLHADNDVIREIAAFIMNKKRHTPSIGKFIRENRSCIRKSVNPCAINVRGRYHNLKDIFDLLNKRYFHDRIKALITWGKKRSRWYKGKRTLGSYDKMANMIRINPLLDQKSVPRYFVEFVVYHEMIHADMQTKKDAARRLVHNKEFKKRELLFEKYEKAIQWEKRYLR